MKSLFTTAVLIGIAFSTSSRVSAQEFPKPGPEHEWLKKMEGNWDCTMKMAGMEAKCKATYKMDLGGLWLASTFEGEVLGQKFTGRGYDSYDAGKKKFVSVWLDSMSTAPMTMEGTYDKEKKTLTMAGEATGPDGKPAKMKSVSEFKSDDHHTFTMYMGDAKEPAFVIEYKRAK